MTASLDRAVEAFDSYFRSGNDVPIERAVIPAAEWHKLRDTIAALPHLGVDREALRGLAEKWSVRARANTARHEMGDGDGYRLAANNAQLCADDLLNLIETNQEPGHAR